MSAGDFVGELSPAAWSELSELLGASAARLREDASFEPFMAWFVATAEAGAPKLVDALERTFGAGQARMILPGLALRVRDSMPLPANRFRPERVRLPERNAPCYCGSGLKYKRCCRGRELPEPGDGVELLGAMLDTFPTEALGALDLRAADAFDLAEVASLWSRAWRTERVVALLEPMFDAGRKRHRDADLLLDALVANWHVDPAHASGDDERFEDDGLEDDGRFEDENAATSRERSVFEHARRDAFLARLQGDADPEVANVARDARIELAARHGDFDAAWSLRADIPGDRADARARARTGIVILRESDRGERARALAERFAADARTAIATMDDPARVEDVLEDVGYLLAITEPPSPAELLREVAGSDAVVDRWCRLLARAPSEPGLYAPRADGHGHPIRTAELERLESGASGLSRPASLLDGMAAARSLAWLEREPRALSSFALLRDLILRLLRDLRPHHHGRDEDDAAEALYDLLLARAEHLLHAWSRGAREPLGADEVQHPPEWSDAELAAVPRLAGPPGLDVRDDGAPDDAALWMHGQAYAAAAARRPVDQACLLRLGALCERLGALPGIPFGDVGIARLLILDRAEEALARLDSQAPAAGTPLEPMRLLALRKLDREPEARAALETALETVPDDHLPWIRMLLMSDRDWLEHFAVPGHGLLECAERMTPAMHRTLLRETWREDGGLAWLATFAGDAPERVFVPPDTVLH